MTTETDIRSEIHDLEMMLIDIKEAHIDFDSEDEMLIEMELIQDNIKALKWDLEELQGDKQ